MSFPPPGHHRQGQEEREEDGPDPGQRAGAPAIHPHPGHHGPYDSPHAPTGGKGRGGRSEGRATKTLTDQRHYRISTLLDSVTGEVDRQVLLELYNNGYLRLQ